MAKVQAQAGDSLADVYDVQGSIAGIDHLVTHDLPIVHEMGGTVFSERVAGGITRAQTGAITQTQAFGDVITGFAPGMTRILGVSVFVDTAARMGDLVVSIRSGPEGREVPIWAWDSTVDVEMAVRLVDDGAAAANFTLLRPVTLLENLPSMLFGADQRRVIDEIAIRGNTLTFGAGDVEATVLITTAFASLEGVSSRGLPLPSW